MSKIKMLNKTMTTILITLLTLPILLAVIPRASAILVTTCTPVFGPIGTTVTIIGTVASAGGSIYVYWDNLGGAVLNSTAYADGAGAYSVMATIPTAVGGVHSLIVKDVSTGATVGTYFTITSTTTLTPTSGIPADSIAVAGTGFAGTSGIFFNSAASRLLASGTGESATYAAAPTVRGTLSAYLVSPGTTATHYAYARVYPNSTSTITVSTLGAGNMPKFDYWFVGTNNVQPPALELQFKAATGTGVVEVTVFGYAAAGSGRWPTTAGAWQTTPTDIMSNYAVAYGTTTTGTEIKIEAGSNPLSAVKTAINARDVLSDSWALTRVTAQVGWLGLTQPQSCYVDTFVFGPLTYDLEQPIANATYTAPGAIASSFTVPNLGYASYTVAAVDDAGNNNATAFTIGEAITLTPTTGPTGTVVTIAGRGFTAEIHTIAIHVATILATEVVDISSLADGTFTGQFIVPTIIDTTLGSKTVSATDAHRTATGLFMVTGNTTITLTPTTGAVGALVTIAGVNFTAIASKAVTVTFHGISVATLYTNATGGFSGTFTVPSLTASPDPYTVIALDAPASLTAHEHFVIATTFLTISPVKCPTGTSATVQGYGFTTPSGTANVTIGTLRVLTNILDTLLVTGTTFIVPTLPVGIYTVTALDSSLLTASTTYEVNATTTVTLSSSSGIAVATVALNASYFKAAQALTFTFKNATYTQALSLTPATGSGYSGQTTIAGLYNGTFTVPTVAIGSYTINATDSNNCTVEVSFSVVLAVPTITLNPTESLIGAVVNVTGTTFRASTAVNIYFGSTLVRTVNSTSGGALLPSNVNFTVPDVSYGTYTVSASDGVNSATATFNVLGVHGIDTTMIAEIEAKLDQYGSFWNFTNTWFTTISNKLGVFTGADTVASLLYSIKTSVSTINWADITAIKAKTDTINWADITSIKSTTSLSIDYLWGLQDHPLWGLRTKIVPMLESIKNATQFTAGTYSTTIPTSAAPVNLGKSSKITLTVRATDDTTAGFVIKAYIYDGIAWRPLSFSVLGIASADCAATVEFTTGADGRLYFETTGATFTAFIYSAEFSP